MQVYLDNCGMGIFESAVSTGVEVLVINVVTGILGILKTCCLFLDIPKISVFHCSRVEDWMLFNKGVLKIVSEDDYRGMLFLG